MNVIELSPMTVFTKAYSWARKLDVHYGDPLKDGDPSKPFRPSGWDCSWFVADCIRAITEIGDIYTGSYASQACTGAFCALCSDLPDLSWMQLPLLFLYDKESTTYPQKTVHVGIALPNYAFIRMLIDFDPSVLEQVYTLDLFTRTGQVPLVHPVSSWFTAFPPASGVGVRSFPGVVAPDFGTNRYIVAPAFMNLEKIVKLPSLRA